MKAEPPLPGTADVGGGGRSVTVLVADDNEVALRLCRRVLEKAGYKVLTASDGLEAVSLALANLPDLVFLDIAMPGMDGLEAMRRIKEQRPGMVIVVWGAHLLPSDRERFLAAGAVEMMIPPFKLTDLLAVAAQFTGNRGSVPVPAKAGATLAPGMAHEADLPDGPNVPEQKILETAIRITVGIAGLLTRTNFEGNQAVIMSRGLPAEVDAMQFHRGQGIIGTVMQSHGAIAVADVSESFDLAIPPDLAAYGFQAGICVPILEDGRLWGTISVFDVKKREWTEDDQRVLAALGNQGMLALRNAELYDDDQRGIWELRNLQEALQAATSTLDLKQVLQQVLFGAAKASSAQIGCIALEESGKLIFKSGFGTDSTTAEKLALGVGGDICRDVMASAKPFMEAMEQGATNDSPLNPRAVLCVPITLRGKPFGVLFLANYQVGRAFTPDHRNRVTELAAMGAMAIDNARLFTEREGLILQSTAALVNVVDSTQPDIGGHSARVTQYASLIARQMKYSPKDPAAWARLERGGRLHDIGMIGVPDAILHKTGLLTDEEFATMKAHTTIGFQILSGLQMLTDELVIVRSHHERYDGTGYPERKKGGELPIFVWIVSAADAIDAMTSERPFRQAMSFEAAVEQVRLGASTQLHPDVAEAVLEAANIGTLRRIPH